MDLRRLCREELYIRRIFCLILFIAAPSLSIRLDSQSTAHSPIVTVDKATIIAFYPPVLKADEANDDSNEALGDFQYYAGQIKQLLGKTNIRFEELYVRSFRVHVEGQTITFHPKEAVGYYFIASGKKPHVEYGVRTDVDLLDIAKGYFGLLENRK